jgi:drug/metabolite transporter (DMT)-like permease
MMRRMGKEVHAVQGPIYFGASNAVLCLILQMTIGLPVRAPYSPYGIILLLVMGCFGWMALHFLALAMQVEKAGRAAPLNYL